MSRALVIGASGQVGEHLLRRLGGPGDNAAGTYLQHARPGLHRLDLRDEGAVAALLDRLKPEIVYIPASWTSVDYCELHPEKTRRTNVLAVESLVREAVRVKARPVYFSSDYVFDGSAGPYSEEDPARPINEYGRQKLEAERHVARGAADSLILRTTVVYGWETRGKNFVQQLLDRLGAGKELRVPADQIGSPTYAPNLAEAAVELAASGARGVYHVAGPALVSRYDFAVEAAGVFGLDPALVKAAATSELGQAAPRPLKAGMLVDKAGAALKTPLLDHKEGLRRMRAERR